MIRDGSPIYPLGSFQDTAIQLSLMKDLAIEAKKFSYNIQLNLIGSLLTQASKSKGKELQDIFYELLDTSQLYIQYRDKEAEQYITKKRDLDSQRLQIVSEMSKAPAINSELKLIDEPVSGTLKKAGL